MAAPSNTPSRRHLSLEVTAAVLCIIAASARAEAQEYCVSCKGPDAVYRCVLDVEKPPGMPLKMLCITRLAKEGGHSSCSVRGGTVFDCVGQKRIVSIDPPANTPHKPQGAPQAGGGTATLRAPEPLPPKATPAIKPAVPDKAQVPPVNPSAARDQPPQTVEELAKRTGKASTQTLKQATDQISESTQKAWNCVTSLFKSC